MQGFLSCAVPSADVPHPAFGRSSQASPNPSLFCLATLPSRTSTSTPRSLMSGLIRLILFVPLLIFQVHADRSRQILGIFIRDVTSGPSRSSTGNTFASSSSTSSASSIRSDRSTPPASPSLAAITTGSVVESSSGPGRVHRIASAIRPGFTRSSTTATTPSRSRSNSLLAPAQALNPTNEPTWDALSPNNPPFDLAIANTSLERQQQANNESTPPTVSESDLDPVDNAPPSPKFDAVAVTVPDEVVAEEAVSSARAKQLKRAEEFAGRFMKARSELGVKGVVVEKFREASEIEEIVHGLVFGKKGE